MLVIEIQYKFIKKTFTRVREKDRELIWLTA